MNPVIPFARPDISGNEIKYVTEAVTTGWLTHAGRFEKEFEAKFSDFVGKPSLATSSGTGALHVALLTLGVGPGDEVIIPDLTFGATASVVMAVGATPVLIDIDPQTWGLDKNQIAMRLTKRTRAIIPVHLYGEDAGEFKGFGVPVVEDACEALGMVPLRGELTCYSFYGNKIITTGEGGMVCGNLGNAQDWRDGGFDSDYSHRVAGLNYRATNLQCALGLAQMERIHSLVAKRLQNQKAYLKNIKGRGKWVFVTEVENPRMMAEKLRPLVETRPVFTPLHRCPAFRHLKRGNYKVSEWVWANHICLPLGTHLTEEQIEKICEAVNGNICIP